MRSRRRYACSLILVALAAGALGVSRSRAADTDLVALQLAAPSIDASILITRQDGTQSRCPSSGRCILRMERYSTVTLGAENGTVSRFQSWTQGCGAQDPMNPTCVVQVNSDVVWVLARFSPLRLWYPSFGPGRISVQPESGQSGQPCVNQGPSCQDIANGQIVRLQAEVDGWAVTAGYRFSGWSGLCERVRTAVCRIRMTNNQIVGAGFEKPRETNCGDDLEPGLGQSCDPVKGSNVFTIRVQGKGAVVAPKTGALPGMNCETTSPAGKSCSLRRYREEYVDLRAIAKYGLRFRGWGGGRCGGTGKCHFYNKRYDSGPRVVTAYFR